MLQLWRWLVVVGWPQAVRCSPQTMDGMTAAGFIWRHDRNGVFCVYPAWVEIPLDNPERKPQMKSIRLKSQSNGRLGFRTNKVPLTQDFTMCLKFVLGQVGDLSTL